MGVGWGRTTPKQRPELSQEVGRSTPGEGTSPGDRTIPGPSLYSLWFTEVKRPREGGYLRPHSDGGVAGQNAALLGPELVPPQPISGEQPG